MKLVLEYHRGVHRVYQYLYGVEFESSKVNEYIEMLRKMEEIGHYDAREETWSGVNLEGVNPEWVLVVVLVVLGGPGGSSGPGSGFVTVASC